MKKPGIESKDKSVVDNSAESFLGKGTIMTGTLKFPGNLTYNGHFKGKIVSKGKLIVGETGEIDSEISVAVALNSGEIRGSIYASERIQILPYGKIEGSVRTPDLQIESGAVFNGKSEMPTPLPRVISTDNKEERGKKNKKERGRTTSRGETPQQPLSKQGTKAGRSSSLFPLFSLAALLAMFYGAGVLKKHLPSPTTVQKVENTSAALKAPEGREKNSQERANTDKTITPPMETQLSPENNSQVRADPGEVKRGAPKPRAAEGHKRARVENIAKAAPEKRRVKRIKVKQAVKTEKKQKRPLKVSEISPRAPVDIATLKRVASTQISEGFHKKAIDTLKKILEISPSDKATNLKLSRIYFNSGYGKLADIQFAVYEKLEPTGVEAEINEGFRQFNRKNRQKALSIFKGALIQEPSNIRAKYGVAAVYSKQNFYSKAIQICKSTLKDTPGIIPFKNELAWLNGRKKGSPAGNISLSTL